jgi:hypothetical protein
MKCPACGRNIRAATPHYAIVDGVNTKVCVGCLKLQKAIHHIKPTLFIDNNGAFLDQCDPQDPMAHFIRVSESRVSTLKKLGIHVVEALKE